MQRYFSQLTFKPIDQNVRHYFHTPNAQMDYYINQISKSCELVMADIVKNLNQPADREALILCYRVLLNEAYKEGLGNKYNSNNPIYNNEKDAIAALWANNSRLKSVVLDNDINKNQCRQTVNKLYTLLYSAESKMHDNSLWRDLKLKDLQAVIALSLNTSSLAAMHDYTAEFLNHQICGMNPQIIQTMQQAANTQQTTQTTDYGNTF